MEKIREWINDNPIGSGDGSGYGDGYGSGYGDGYGYGDGSGYGSGYGDGDGYGSGYGDGSGLKSLNGQEIFLIDGVETLIDSVKLSLAKGYILNNDLTKTPCYVMKGHGYFAHGDTPEKARVALQTKIFENLDPDEAIERFLETFKWGEKYPGSEFFKWHNYLTGSCEMGRNAFIRDRGLSVEDYYTVDEFIEICENAYGGNIIKQLKEKYK